MKSYLTGQSYPAEFVRTIDLVPGDGPNQPAAEEQIAPAVETFLSDVNAFLATTSYSGPAKTKIAIVGWSMGGFSSRWYAAQVAPERVERWIGLAGANHGTQCACDLSCGISPPTVHPNGLDDLCPPFSSDSAQAMQLALNGPPGGAVDETPYGYGGDSVGKTSIPFDATRRILYSAIHVGHETFILPNSSAEIDGAGGIAVELPPGSSAQETSPGNFLLPNDDHISVGAFSTDSFALVLALLRAPLPTTETPAPPTHTPTQTATATPTDTPVITPTATATLAAGCPAVPDTGCRTAQKSRLILKDSADDGKDRLIWRWTNGRATTQTELGDPTATANYALCVYDAAGLLLGTRVPADSAKWSVLSDKGYRYTDTAGTAGGITKVLLKGSDQNKSRALVKGKGSNLPDPILGNLPSPITAQLHNQETGVCLEGVYDDANVIKNGSDQFRGKAP